LEVWDIEDPYEVGGHTCHPGDALLLDETHAILGIEGTIHHHHAMAGRQRCGGESDRLRMVEGATKHVDLIRVADSEHVEEAGLTQIRRGALSGGRDPV